MSTEPTEKIVFLPPAGGQANPSFHVAPELSEAFIAFLKERGISPWLPPEDREKPEVEGIQIIEIKPDPETSIADLEAMGGEFMGSHSL